MLKKAKKKNSKDMDEEILKKIIEEMSSMEIEGPKGKKIKPDAVSVSVKSMGLPKDKEFDESLPEKKDKTHKLPDVLDKRFLDEEPGYEEEIEEDYDEDTPIHEVPIEKIPGLEGEDDEISKKDPWPGVKKELEELRAKVGKIEGMIGKGYYKE